MAGHTLAEPMTAPTTARPSPTVRRAGLVLLAAGALGLAGQWLFFGVALGINFPIAIALLVASGWIARAERSVRLSDAWLGPASIGLAAFAAIRSDPSIVALDVLASLTLAGAALASFGGRNVVSRSFGAILRLATAAVGWVAAGAVVALSSAQLRLPSGPAVARSLPVLRGLAIAIPIALVFVALFASADAVFADLVDDLVAFELNADDLIGRVMVATILGWLAAGGLAFAASRGDPVAEPEVSARVAGTTEVVTILLILNLVFAVFVALQGAYLFGGLDTLAATGLTYAEYARRGFFELVAVATLAGGLIVGAEQLARARTPLLVATAIGLAVQTGVVLASAALRLRLYQEAYGWTELRLYVLATIVVLGIGLVALVASVATDRVRWIGHVLVVVSLVTGFALNLLGPVRFITEQNVARALDPSLVPANGYAGLDIGYIGRLGDDAIPGLIRALPAVDAKSREVLAAELSSRLSQLRTDDGLNAWQAWNAGRNGARDALEDAREAGAIP
jgi:hypothetical protein